MKITKFQSYIQKLQALDPKASLIRGEKAAIFLSGSSDWETACLREPQKEFMQILADSGYLVPNSNFPYHRDFEYRALTWPPLWQAGLRNLFYAWQTIHHYAFRRQLRRHLKPLTKRQEVVIVTGSSGLHILNEILPDLDFGNTKLTIFALGPVSKKKRQTGKARLYVIKGKKDWYSRLFDRHRADALVDCDHYDYCSSDAVKEIIRQQLGI